jgi:peptidyl-prolyl cis-trans isomerase B (cyclophilin B)
LNQVKISHALAAFTLVAAATLGAGAAADDPGRFAARAELARAADPALAALLDGEPSAAARAALALGRSKRPEARAMLRAHLSATNPSVRAMVAYALGLLADPDALGQERELAKSDPSSGVRYAAVDAIDRIVAANPAEGTRPVADVVLAAVAADRDPIVRGHAAISLQAFRERTDANSIAAAIATAYIHEKDATVRWHLMWTLFRGYGKVAPRDVLQRALKDRSDLVRVEALRAWGRRTDPDAATFVKPFLNDPSWRVQEEASEALKRIAKQPPTEHLIALQPNLHLPPADPQNTETALPRPNPVATGGAPTVEDLVAAQPLRANSAALLNGPMPGPHPRVRIRTTKGDIVIRLYPEWAPFTVTNFLRLADRGYYDNNRWFRIVPDFVVQTGDPHDDGEGDAGYTIPAEENPVEQRTGIISMGLNYEKDHAIRDSAGTQFYLTVSPQLHLDRDFTVFGEVEKGFGTIARLIESDRMIRVEQLPAK